MKTEEQDNRKLTITKYFIDALDYLIDSNRLKSVADFERITGFRQQRITGMRKFLTDGDGKGYFANTDHIAVMHEKFGVSLKFLICGERPIIEQKINLENTLAEPRAVYETKFIQQLQEQFDLLSKKQDFLTEQFKFFQEKFKN